MAKSHDRFPIDSDGLDSIAPTDALRHAVLFSQTDRDYSTMLGSSKDDPAEMDWDHCTPRPAPLVKRPKSLEDEEITPIDDGGLTRPNVILLGCRAWDGPKVGPCPVCDGKGDDLSDGPPKDHYCAYCDRYGLDTIATRRNAAKRHETIVGSLKDRVREKRTRRPQRDRAMLNEFGDAIDELKAKRKPS